MTTMRTQTTTAKTTRKSNNEEARRAFVGKLAEARKLMERIEKHLDDHMGVPPEEINWGHHGDACRIVHLLKEITEACGLTGEGK
jgi:hypothetical protein